MADFPKPDVRPLNPEHSSPSLEQRLADLAPDVRTRVELVLLNTLESELAFEAAAGQSSHSRTSHSRSRR